MIQKIYSKTYSAQCANTHLDAPAFKVDGMIYSVKIKTSEEQTMTFLRNKNFSNTTSSKVITESNL